MKLKKYLTVSLAGFIAAATVGCSNDTRIVEPTDDNVIEESVVNSIEVKEGSTVNMCGIDMTFGKGEFTYEAIPREKEDICITFKADPDKVYYQLFLEVKNNNKEVALATDPLKYVSLIYGDGYEYPGVVALESIDKTNFENPLGSYIMPLETRNARLLFEVPKEAETSKEPITIEIETKKGDAYTYRAK